MPLPTDSSIHFIDIAILPPDTSVGLHTHTSSTEVYLILDGDGIYHADDESINVRSGDVLINHKGRHSLVNKSNRNLKVFVIEAGIKKKN